MRKISFTKAFMLAFALLAGYSVHQAQASAGLSDLEKRNVEALSSGYVFVEKSSCFNEVTEAPENEPLAVLVVKCKGCTYKWVTSASDSDECSAKSRN